MALLRKASDVHRISQVVHVLFKNGLGYFVEELELKFHLPFFKKIMRHKFKSPVRPEERLRHALEELGGTYIKLGQLLSIRPDLIHLEYCRELQKLQDEVAPFAFKEVRELVEKELKKPLKRLFKSFNEKPIAAASIGQVHEAKLMKGTRVAVKVQRPHIGETMESDIDIITYFARKMEKYEKFKTYKPSLIVEEFKRYTENELDYITEAGNAERFYRNFSGSKTIKIPKVHWDYTTHKVLTLEYIDGVKITDLIRSRQSFNKKMVVKEGLAAEFKQIFEDGFFHADLHPGNILLLKDKRIAFLDFGIVGTMTPIMQRHSVALFLAIMDRNNAATAEILLKVGIPSKNTDKEAFRNDVSIILNKWYGRNLSQERVTHMFHRLFNTCLEHDIRMPADMVLLGKALVTIEATCQLLEPEFDFAQNSKPYLKKIMAKKSALQMRELIKYYQRFKYAVVAFPERASALLDTIKKPTVKVDIEDSDIKRLGIEIDRSSNRLSYGILISALVIAGAIVMSVAPGPKILGISLISAMFFIIAAILGGFLLYSVLTESK